MAARPDIEGYVAGTLYPSRHHAMFTPSWIEAMAERHGCGSRPPRAPFSHVDLGCGDGYGLIVNAAAHPEGQFLGIDITPGHIVRGRALIERFGLTNIELRCQGFSDALNGACGFADVVTAHGVLSWVTDENRARLRSLAARMLCPGGVFVVSFNAMPGWQPLVAFQKLLLAAADPAIASATERFETARAQVEGSGLVDASIFEWLGSNHDVSRDYFAHEYLNQGWKPFWADEAMAAMAAAGFAYAGSAIPHRLRDDLGLRAKTREAVAAIANPAAREVGIDLATANWFRIDLFRKLPAPAVPYDNGWLDRWWIGLPTASDAVWAATTPAGTIKFDTPAAHAIMRHLEAGPSVLRSLPDFSDADLLNSADALLISGQIRPASAPCDLPLAAAVNRAIMEEGEDCLNGLAGRCGAVTIPTTSPETLSAETLKRIGVEVCPTGR